MGQEDNGYGKFEYQGACGKGQGSMCIVLVRCMRMWLGRQDLGIRKDKVGRYRWPGIYLLGGKYGCKYDSEWV